MSLSDLSTAASPSPRRERPLVASPGGKTPRTSLALSDDLRDILLREGSQRGALIDALRRVILDSATFYGLPAPAREALERDMGALGLSEQRDYVMWLLMERCAAVVLAEGDVPSNEAA